MEDLMARTMVENLSIGINPITGKVLPKQDSCYNEIVQEAIKIVLENCSIDSYATILEKQRKEKEEKAAARKKQREEGYPNQGKQWTRDEDWKLGALYNNGYSVYHIANILKRSPASIKTRIKRLRE